MSFFQLRSTGQFKPSGTLAPSVSLSVFDSVTVSENVRISYSLPSPMVDTVTVSEFVSVSLKLNVSVSESLKVLEGPIISGTTALDSMIDTIAVPRAFTATNKWWGQGFTASFTGILATASFYIIKGIGSPTGPMYIEIYAATGLFTSTGTPTGAPLATSGSIDASTTTAGYVSTLFTFSGGNKITLTGGVNYYVVLKHTTGDASNQIYGGASNGTGTALGHSVYSTDGTAWNPVSNGFDMSFFVNADSGVPQINTLVRISVSDTVTTTENIVSTTTFSAISLSIFDLITLSDVVLKSTINTRISVSDQVSISENVLPRTGLSISVSDQITVTENIALRINTSFSVSEIVTVSENTSFLLPVINLFTFEIVSTTEQFYILNGLYEEPMETVTLSEDVKMEVVLIVSVNESITIAEGPLTSGGGAPTSTAVVNPGTMAEDTSFGAGAWGGGGTPIAWGAVEDDQYTQAQTIGASGSYYLVAKNFGFSIPTGSTITGVLTGTRGRTNSSTGSHWAQARIVKGGVISGTNQADNASVTASLPPAAYKSFGGSTNMWGTTLTAEDVNDPGFGYAVAFTNTSTTRNFFVDAMRLSVYYTEPAAGGTPEVHIVSYMVPVETVTVTESFDKVIPYLTINTSESVSVSETFTSLIVVDEFLTEEITVSEYISLVINTELSVSENVIVSEYLNIHETWDLFCSDSISTRDWVSVRRPPLAYDPPEYVPVGTNATLDFSYSGYKDDTGYMDYSGSGY